MIFVTCWQRNSLDEQQDCLAQFRHIFPAFPGKLDVTAELSAVDWISQALDAEVLE